MLVNATHLKGLTIRAVDGEIGTVAQFYFDDVSWAIRYLVVDTGNWLDGRRVLISPYPIAAVDWQAHGVDVPLTKKQVELSPNIDLHRPISLQHESEFLAHYGYPFYWTNTDLWVSEFTPPVLPIIAPDRATDGKPPLRDPADEHLRSNDEVHNYRIEAEDGEIGHVEGYIMDDENWTIRYIEVATKNWWPGKMVLVAPEWIKRVSWGDSSVVVGLTRGAIQSCPAYSAAEPITRYYEAQLYAHYGMAPYWMRESGR